MFKSILKNSKFFKIFKKNNENKIKKLIVL